MNVLVIIFLVCIFLLSIRLLRSLLYRTVYLRKIYRNITPLSISWIPFVGNFHHIRKGGVSYYKLVLRLSNEAQQQTKGIFCIWYALLPIIFLSSHDGLEKFINHSKQLSKSANYELLHPWLKTGLLTSNNEKWRNRRRLITPSFHDNQLLKNFMSIFNEQAQVLVERFVQLAKNKTVHQLYPYISACTLDIITEAATGTKADAQSSESRNDFVQATLRISEIITKRVRTPWLWPAIIFDNSSYGREQKQVLQILHGFSRKVIEERVKSFDLQEMHTDDHRKRLVFLDCLIAQMQQEKLTIDDIQEEVDTFMFEGHDTTAAAVTYFCYLMGRYPDIQTKVQEELDSIFGDDHERECTMDDIQKMTYLDCVIKESLRLFPPVAMIGREAQEDFYHHGQLIPKGAIVNIIISAIHRDPSVYPNPDEFDPSRFAENSVINAQRSPFAFIPFSAGSRNCIGQRFANLEERVILSTLLRRFSFRSTQTVDELGLLNLLLLRTENPILMYIESRY